MKKLDLSVLPAPQRMLWDNLHPFSGFVLYGGTAIALQLGHRQSVDFDFFSNDPLNLDSLEQELNPIGKAVLLRRLNNTLEYLIDGVKVSFFGSLSFFGDVYGLSPEQENVLESAASTVREVPVIHPVSHRMNADITAHGEDIKDSDPAMLPKEETTAKKKWW
ncbi:MAG: nucleotidyl transferase AbiEii/AbiGii toxin family protein [Opitutales bacterium]|nr:nucleotidyl transferase AbiEii/AbiGii toxin family protein [Opitutales bacterium]